uniref:Kelch like family member 10 n=1 Tax=Cyprinodon variegatus TaxID=28743 RepID=A0A3Q2DTA1_CYPVA
MGTASNNVWKEMYLEGTLCDAMIRVKDAEFKVHKLVLMEPSAYFRDLFLRKQSTEQQVYSFSNVSSHIMELILEYAYTSCVELTEDTVEELLEAADYFAISGVTQACCDFLQQKISSKNCINTWKLAELHEFLDLKKMAYFYILEHFEEVVELCADFQLLSVMRLVDLIERAELNVRNESFVFEAILRWVKFAPDKRRRHMEILLSKVRLILLPTTYLANTVCKEDLVRNNKHCVNMVVRVIKILRQHGLRRPLSSYRLPAHVLLAIGGFEENYPSGKIDLYNVRTDSWSTAYENTLAFPQFCGCIYSKGNIYFIGGSKDNICLNSVTSFNLATKTWKEVGTMHDARCYLSVAMLDDQIYAMGGHNMVITLNTAERFNPDTNQWTLIAPMQNRRTDAASAALHGKIYICGGFTVVGKLSSCEVYNPDTDQWTFITRMESGRSGVGVIAYNDQLYVLGGCDDRRVISEVLAYDPSFQCWHTLTPMVHPRRAFGVVLLEDQLYVVGGLAEDDEVATAEVERYDWKTKTWNIVQDLQVPRGAIKCCTVERIPHATHNPAVIRNNMTLRHLVHCSFADDIVFFV